ncbi:MAG: ATP-binding protein [Candidatus Gastranaerophilales bacterium]|nr:ATP-binding protein [Candidatus Gastranaerophilales bacterium]
MIISALNGSIPLKNSYTSNKKSSKQQTTNPIQKNISQSKEENSVKNRKNAYSPSFGMDPFFIMACALYGGFYALTCSIAMYQTEKMDKERAEERLKLAQEQNKRIKQTSNELGVTAEEAETYLYDFISRAEIKPSNDGNEIGLNAVRGYGVEKYKLAVDFIAPVISAQETKNTSRVPNGMILYGPTGGGKTYMSDKVCEHLEHFGTKTTKIELDPIDHEKNCETIQKAYFDGIQDYKTTGKFTVINFVNDVDNLLPDRRYDNSAKKEIGLLLRYTEDSASKGVVWLATANNPKDIDPAILRPGRMDFKLPVGNMEKFAIADMVKYSLIKYDEYDKDKKFKYDKIVNFIDENNQNFTPSELEFFVESAKNHKENPNEKINADMVLAEMQEYIGNDFQTLDEKTVKKFKEDQFYMDTIKNQKETD